MNEKKDIYKLLSQYNDEKIVYMPDPGNAGDNVIASATYAVFEKCGIEFEYYSDRISMKGRRLFYGGGGNLTKYYTNARILFDRHHHEVKEFVLLPHTIDNHKSLLHDLGENVTLICRERTSFDYVKDEAKKCRVLLTDDMAFTLDVKKIINHKSVFPSNLRDIINTIRFLPKVFLIERRIAKAQLSVTGNVLQAFRTDVEAPGRELNAGNIDVSEVLRHRMYPRYICDRITHAFVKCINNYDIIRTDRLHVCIVAALLGKEVKFYPGSYYKNEAVYKMSLENDFSNVQFINDIS